MKKKCTTSHPSIRMLLLTLLVTLHIFSSCTQHTKQVMLGSGWELGEGMNSNRHPMRLSSMRLNVQLIACTWVVCSLGLIWFFIRNPYLYNMPGGFNSNSSVIGNNINTTVFP